MTALIFIITGALVFILVLLALTTGDPTPELNIKGATALPNRRKDPQP